MQHVCITVGPKNHKHEIQKSLTRVSLTPIPDRLSVNYGQKIQFLGIDLGAFPDKKSNKNFKILILEIELASILDKKSRTFFTFSGLILPTR